MTASIFLRGETDPSALVVGQRKTTTATVRECLVLFDDTVLDKRHSASIELSRRQYSGNEHQHSRHRTDYVCMSMDNWAVLGHRLSTV